MMNTRREKEVIYFALSRLLDEPTELSQKEFNEVDALRDKFYQGKDMLTLEDEE